MVYSNRIRVISKHPVFARVYGAPEVNYCLSTNSIIHLWGKLLQLRLKHLIL